MRAHKSKNPKHEANPKIQTQIQSTNPKSKDRKQEGITLQMQAPPIAIAPEALLHKITQMQLQCTCTEAAAHKSKNPIRFIHHFRSMCVPKAICPFHFRSISVPLPNVEIFAMSAKQLGFCFFGQF